MTRQRVQPADDVLGDVMGELEQVFAALAALGARFADLVEQTGQPSREHVASLRPAIFDLLAAHRELVTGAGIVTAPGLLADAPRWLEWWWTTTRGAPEALRVNLDPGAPDFYDYTTTDWYATPERTRLARMAGPFVDFACTNEYAITLSSPVHAGGEMLGVAAADVLVSSVEGRVLPTLVALDRAVALTNADGRVITSNTPAVVTGQRVDAGAQGASSWLLVETS
ncbi:MAG TPA: cache domain-containing protein [Solirubrobacteraceae bacterium]|nr:cache domain-containing protein [Solirubrobacteraceae bacterium]